MWNLEVHGERVYHAGTAGVLVHSVGDCASILARISPESLSRLTTSARKSMKSWRKLIVEHKENRDAYKANPVAHDNEGRRIGKMPDTRKKISSSRIWHLENKFPGWAKQSDNALEEVGS